MSKRRKLWWNGKNRRNCSLNELHGDSLFRTFSSYSFNFNGGLCNIRTRGGHSQTNVLPTRVQTPQKWTLNGVLRHIKFAPLNGVTPVKHNLNGVIMGVTYTLNGVLCYGTQYNTLNGVLCYGTHYNTLIDLLCIYGTQYNTLNIIISEEMRTTGN